MPKKTSGNPVLSEKIFGRSGVEGADRMTVSGTVNKTFLLLFILAAVALWPISKFYAADDISALNSYLYGGLIGGLIVGLITAFKPNLARWTAPIYAAFEGLVLGAISMVFEVSYPGIAVQALGLTGAVTLVMLVLYRTRVIKVTNKLRSGIISATGGVLLFYIGVMIARLFGADVGFLSDGGPVAILIGLVIVGIAAFNLLLDFDFIERAASAGADKKLEWYGAFGLLVTLVWLYLEVLRLLGNSRR